MVFFTSRGKTQILPLEKQPLGKLRRRGDWIMVDSGEV
jgi:hypothetical protein